MFPHNRIFIFTLTVTLASAQFITFDDGKLGVNFGGFRAAVGLGGLLNGDLSKGGLHVEAGTPFGQSARAGLGGSIGTGGSANGGLYAGATAGNGVSAAAGLEGAADGSGSVGSLAAGASAGGVVKSVEKTSFRENPGSTFTVEKTLNTAPSDTVVVKTVRRPVLNKFAQAHYDALSNVITEEPISVIPKKPVVIQNEVPSGPYRGGLLTRLFAGLGSAPSASGESVGVVYKDVPVKTTGYATTATGTLSSRGDLFTDIFNIPISTLQAVNRLVNNIAGGGSVSVTKTAYTK